jgi:hypothetical protein
MVDENKRRFERVNATARVKLPGDAGWTECDNSNVSGAGLFFETSKQLQTGDFVTLQFMLQSESGSVANIHFFTSAKVVRIEPRGDKFQIAVEFIIDDAVRKEILKVVETIKSHNLRVERPTTAEAILHKEKHE